MTLPRWNDPRLKAGTMVRTALWLISEVGVGKSFTKEKHRAAFSGVTQADRRLRDLRAFGWVIHTRAEDLTLRVDEQRFVAAGIPVWENGARKSTAAKILTAKVRRATFAENDYQCVVCGIAGGESYPDAPHVNAVLGISRRSVTTSNGQVRKMFITECKRCRAGATLEAADISHMMATIDSLDIADRRLFVRWAERGRRSALDRLWADFRRLPETARETIRRQLAGD